VTTKEELIDGYKMVVREAKRITSSFADGDWAKPVDDGEGWNRKQTFAHIAASAEIAPSFLDNLAQAGESDNPMANLDLNAFNAQMVGAKEALSPQDLLTNLSSAYDKLTEYTKSMSPDVLDARRNFGLLEGGTVSDVMDSVLVLHAMAHIYHAGGNAA
jgi:hypothetical protein